MKISITFILFFSTFQLFGQHSIFYKSTGKGNLHYIELIHNRAIVYKMGWYIDKAGSGPAVTLIDTLFKGNSLEFKGKYYLLQIDQGRLTQQGHKKWRQQVVQENNIVSIYTELNHAYCLKSFFDLSDRLNKEYPLYHYTFRNGYYAWANRPDKGSMPDQFITQTNKEIQFLYDSISSEQNRFTQTTEFILRNVNQSNYSIIKDSLKKLPIRYSSQFGYFNKSVYEVVKSNPVYFYRLLQDFPNDRKYIWLAVDSDRKLIKQLKRIDGYDELKKEFVKDYNFNKSMGYKIIGTYTVVAALITWLIIAQPK